MDMDRVQLASLGTRDVVQGVQKDRGIEAAGKTHAHGAISGPAHLRAARVPRHRYSVTSLNLP
jgi:hypothetical protein